MVEQQNPCGVFFQGAANALIKRGSKALFSVIPDAFHPVRHFAADCFERLASSNIGFVIDDDDLIGFGCNGFHILRHIARAD